MYTTYTKSFDLPSYHHRIYCFEMYTSEGLDWQVSQGGEPATFH